MEFINPIESINNLDTIIFICVGVAVFLLAFIFGMFLVITDSKRMSKAKALFVLISVIVSTIAFVVLMIVSIYLETVISEKATENTKQIYDSFTEAGYKVDYNEIALNTDVGYTEIYGKNSEGNISSLMIRIGQCGKYYELFVKEGDNFIPLTKTNNESE